jgi:hypothetical protein
MHQVATPDDSEIRVHEPDRHQHFLVPTHHRLDTILKGDNEKMKTRMKTDEFTALAEDGTSVTIEEFTDLIDAGTLDNPNASIRGSKTLLTGDGMHVNVVGEGEYEVVGTGLRLRRP